MKNYFTPEDDKLKWTEGEPKTLLKTVVCKITERHNISSDGVEGDYIIMDAPDWVIVIAELEDKFLMVKQWRHGEAALSIEFPGGVIDKGENAEEAARRELKEETGILVSDLKLFGLYSGADREIHYPNGDVVYSLSVIFITKNFTGEISDPDGEALEHRFFDRENIPKDLFVPDARPILDWAKGIKEVEVK